MPCTVLMSMGEGCAEPTVCTVALIYDLYIKAITLDPCDIRKSKRNSKIGSASRRNPCFYPLRTRVGTLIPQEYSTPSLGLSQPIPRHGSTRGQDPVDCCNEYCAVPKSVNARAWLPCKPAIPYASMAQYIRSTGDHVIQYMIGKSCSLFSCKQAGKQMGNQQIEVE